MKTVECIDCGVTVESKTAARKLCDDCRLTRRRAAQRVRSSARYYAGLSQAAQCAGTCGGIVRIGGNNSRPAGEAMCHACRKAATADSYTTQCAACGITFTPPPSSASRARPRKYCSLPCANSVNTHLMRAANPNADPDTHLSEDERRTRRHARDAKRRAKRRGAERDTKIEPVSPSVVFERDGWRCHICGKKCRTDVNGLHPQGATMDHLIPLSKGGPHTYANISTAHRICNIRKGNKSANDQLALI